LKVGFSWKADSGTFYKRGEQDLFQPNVKHQAYHSNSFVGKHVNTCLQEKAFKKKMILVLSNLFK